MQDACHGVPAPSQPGLDPPIRHSWHLLCFEGHQRHPHWSRWGPESEESAACTPTCTRCWNKHTEKTRGLSPVHGTPRCPSRLTEVADRKDRPPRAGPRGRTAPSAALALPCRRSCSFPGLGPIRRRQGPRGGSLSLRVTPAPPGEAAELSRVGRNGGSPSRGRCLRTSRHRSAWL